MLENIFQSSFWKITPRLNKNICVFPSDVPFEQKVSQDIHQGQSYHLSSIQMSVHAGAHMDTPLHFHPKGEERLAEIYPTLYQRLNGGVYVVETQKAHLNDQLQILPKALEEKEEAIKGKFSRILFKTKSYTPYQSWNPQFCSLSEGLVDILAKWQIQLVGIDTPSIDCAHHSTLMIHQKFYDYNIINLECLDLSLIQGKEYQLLCIPWEIDHSDAWPIQAFLFEK